MQKWLPIVCVGVAAVLSGTLLGWAGSVVFSTPVDVLDSKQYTFVEVVPGEVGSSIALNTEVEWPSTAVGSNLAVGTVTTVDVEDGAFVEAGAPLYTVNLRPVIVAQGDIPAFGELAQGAKGQTVSQLQGMLAKLGFFRGAENGVFGGSTTAAVKSWQKSLGVPQDGVVREGDVIFVPNLPARLSLDRTVVARGSTLLGGEMVVNGFHSEPAFTIPISDSQAALMPTGSRVELTGPAGELWTAYVQGKTTNETGGVSLVLAGADGLSICSSECASVPVSVQVLLPSKVVTTEPTAGLVVPAAALLTNADGTITVIDEDGHKHDVTVVASARGLSIIEGVNEGAKVRVPVSAG